MSAPAKLGAGRAGGLGLIADHEADWALKRTLGYASESAASMGECLSVARRVDVTDGDSWIDEWSALASRVEEQGRQSLAAGHVVSAREALLRASNYFRTAEYGAAPDHPRFHELWGSSVRCFRDAAGYFAHAFEPVEIPFEGCELPGYFCRADPSRDRPTVVVAGGTDSSLEEMCLQAFAAIRRGYNFFSFDHPGHRGAVHLYEHQVKRPDYEVPYAAGFDVLEKLPGTDDRIALVGFSYGGYVAARVAIHEPRVRAVVPNSPIINGRRAVSGGFLAEVIANLASQGNQDLDGVMDEWLGSSPVLAALLRYSRWSFGFKTFAEQFTSTILDEHDLEGDLNELRCPTLALVSAGEGDELLRQAHQYIELAGSERKALHVFSLGDDGTDDHCQIDNQPRFHQLTYDWLDDVFAGSREGSR